MLTKKCSDGKNYKSEILLNNFKIAFNLKKNASNTPFVRKFNLRFNFKQIES